MLNLSRTLGPSNFVPGGFPTVRAFPTMGRSQSSTWIMDHAPCFTHQHLTSNGTCCLFRYKVQSEKSLKAVASECYYGAAKNIRFVVVLNSHCCWPCIISYIGYPSSFVRADSNYESFVLDKIRHRRSTLSAICLHKPRNRNDQKGSSPNHEASNDRTFIDCTE